MKYAEKYRRLPRLSASQVGRAKFRHHNPLVGGKLYIFEQPLYDVYIVGADTATNRQVLFTIPQGQQYTPPGGAAFTKTQWHTWLNQSGQLSAPQKHISRGVTLEFKANVTPHDINFFLVSVLASFRIDQMDFLTIHAQRIGGAGGPYSGAAAGIVTNGKPHVSNFFQLDPSGETIEQQQNFSIVLDPTLFDDGIVAAGGAGPGAFTTDATTCTPPGTGIVLTAYLEGQLARAVQ